mmetsp:Transcript_83662/g.147984  ORF Transcript_83662/g.147984 Transcript_83662/m.147984 type:complete len:224 (-) Transcript_83662:64-735(-)
MTFAYEAALGCRELERPQEVGSLLELGSNCEDLVDQVLHAVDAVLAEIFGDDFVGRQRDALLVHLAEAALVDELTHGLLVGVAKGDVGDDPLQHLQGGLVDLDKGGVVDLAQAQQLQDLAHLGRDTHDTADTHDQDEVGLRLHKVVAGGAGLAAAADEHALALAVLLHVGLGIAEGTLATLLLAASLLGLEAVGALLDGVVAAALLQHVLGHSGCCRCHVGSV